MFEKILVAIDGSEQGWKAFDCAISLGEKYKSEILVLNVIQTSFLEELTYAAELGREFSSATKFKEFKEKREKSKKSTFLLSAFDNMKNIAEKMLDFALERAEKYPYKIETRIQEGHPAQKIVETSENENFNAIVIGSRGLGGFKEFVLGSVSSGVVQHAKIPVIVVKD